MCLACSVTGFGVKSEHLVTEFSSCFFQHKDMLGWAVTNTVEGSLRESETIIAVLESDTKIVDPDQAMYWIASASYLGDQVRQLGHGHSLYLVLITV